MVKKSKIVKIPINKINFGIIYSLRSSQRIRKIAKSILIEKKENGEFTIIEHDRKYAVVLFYYALEELGKAILFEEMKNGAEIKRLSEIDATNVFKDHDIKINKAQERYPDLLIQKLKLEPFKNKSYGKFIPNGEIISNFIERSNLWLVTYNETTGKWEDHLSEIDEEELGSKIDRLDIVLTDWQKKYTTKKTK